MIIWFNISVTGGHLAIPFDSIEQCKANIENVIKGVTEVAENNNMYERHALMIPHHADKAICIDIK